LIDRERGSITEYTNTNTNHHNNIYGVYKEAMIAKLYRAATAVTTIKTTTTTTTVE
jgi:hypothetical protein